MSRQALNELLVELPYPLRERIDGYVSSVATQLPTIFEEANVEASRDFTSKFLFLCGLRKLWAIVDADYRMLTSSMSLMRGRGVDSITVGSAAYTEDSQTVRTVRELHSALSGQFIELGIFNLIREKDLAAVAREMSRERRSTN